MAIEGINENGWKNIPLTSERIKLQRVMDVAMDLRDIDVFIENLPSDCRVLEPAFFDTDCEGYVFDRKGVVQRFAEKSPVVLTPESEDVALYYLGEEMRHIGVLAEGGMVDSKWGTFGPLLRHPLEFIPPDYGSAVCFRRRGKHFKKVRYGFSSRLPQNHSHRPVIRTG